MSIYQTIIDELKWLLGIGWKMVDFKRFGPYSYRVYYLHTSGKRRSSALKF